MTIWPPPVRKSFVSPSVTVISKLKGSPSGSSYGPLCVVLSSVHDVRDSHTGSSNVVGQPQVSRSKLAGLRRKPLVGRPVPAGTGTLRVATVAAAAVIHSGLNSLSFMVWCSP